MEKSLAFGLKCCEFYAIFERQTENGRSWSLKTSQGCLMFAPESIKSSVHFTRSGMMRNGHVYRLAPLEAPIGAIVFGLSDMLPTPTTVMNMTCPSMDHSKAHRNLIDLIKRFDAEEYRSTKIHQDPTRSTQIRADTSNPPRSTQIHPDPPKSIQIPPDLHQRILTHPINES